MSFPKKKSFRNTKGLHKVDTMPEVDLHIHTVFSDGTCTPQEVVWLAKKIGLVAISITDHDSVKGIEKAQKAGRKINLEVVPGVEMGSDVGQDEVHILGYYLDWKQKEFLSRLKFFQGTRMERNERLLHRLKQLGMQITFDELTQLASKEVIGKLHIARCMLEKKYINSIGEAFEKWLNPGKPAHIKRPKISPFEIIDLIREAEGIPVFAHPFLSKRDDLIPKMVDAGLMGIEVYHPVHSPATVKKYKEIAKKFNLLITGGSDCHGKAKGDSLIGTLNIPVSYLGDLKKARDKIAQKLD